MKTRPIPATGEPLPVIGCGTYQGFDRSPGVAAYRQLAGVLEALFTAGGSVLDSSPMYGRAEQSTGEVLAASAHRAQAFVATKVWTQGRDAGIAQMEASMRLLGTSRVDLLQVHNLVDWRTHLGTLRAWRDAGRVRYIGITHYTASAYSDVESVLRTEALDFLQINYSAEEREAAHRLLPLARERGVAVLVNRPFGGGVLGHVGGVAAAGDGAGDGRLAQHELEQDLRPARASDVASPGGQGSASQPAQQGAAAEGAVDQHGNAAFPGQG